jgi:hypothetical protein
MRTTVATFLVAFGCAGSALAQTASTPQPSPEVKKLSMWAGTWKYQGSAPASALGPASTISGQQVGTISGNGFVLTLAGRENGQFGGVEWGETDIYDPGAKLYRYVGWQNDGMVWQGTYSFAGNVSHAEGTQTVKGKSYQARSTTTLAADGKSMDWKLETSADGKTWTLAATQKLTKQP